MTLSPAHLLATLEVAEGITRRAGALLREYYEHPRAANHKSSDIDLVTEADQASEAYIVGALRDAFPDHHIVGEEGGGYGPDPETTPYHWYVDPLDGTTNFAHRYPVFAVSLALSGPDLQPLVGVVYDPMQDETFKALRGQGAWVNGRPLRVSDVDELAAALVITGFPYDVWTSPENNIKHVENFVLRAQGVRRGGSAALDVCYVAAGRADVYWERGARPWDVQAGILCLEEAGGRVSDHQGHDTRDGRSGAYILATNGHLHAPAVRVLTEGDRAPRP